ncbi:ATP-binding protein [Candidatus Methanomassiliicoccus intestinalis]|uniref:ATP-binding protein n=1 Tax=Candidatus Methanomassiliicoccus intestinalis TaxID=1406512 RepID=UPI0037DC0F7C
MSDEEFTFRVSSGLKSIIGRDLISDRYIAVFELVKNSYDAGASKVKIDFSSISENSKRYERISISDNGCGMSRDDIINKWLFVAYSEKKLKNRSENTHVNKIKREVAGAKGVGRFSCDSLGARLQLITKKEEEMNAHILEVNWDDFETDDTNEFINIPVEYSEGYELPTNYAHGTSLIIEKLREDWERKDLIKLRQLLKRLISPDTDTGDLPFEIEINAPLDIEQDKKELDKEEISDYSIVNGLIRNDVFEKLDLKTTGIIVNISKDGKTIETKLLDRGQHIFTLVEKNVEFYYLKDISVHTYYLNAIAKSSFTRQMGMRAKEYGSIFIYRNGFRVNPYGEPGQDIFGIDLRKAQGWKRFLGTREIIGRISINGDKDQFIETTSRAHGFVHTPAVDQLSQFYLDKVLKVLEKYVVNIIYWGQPLKSDPEKTIEPQDVGNKILSEFFIHLDAKSIISLDYNEDILNPNNLLNQSDGILPTLKKLNDVALSTKNENLASLANSLEKKSKAILSQNLNLTKENNEKSQMLRKKTKESQMREKQVYFLRKLTNQDITNLVNGFHTVYTLTDAMGEDLRELNTILSLMHSNDGTKVSETLNRIYKSNVKIRKLSELAIHGNKSLKQIGNNSISDFIRQYVDEGLALDGINYVLDIDENIAYDCKFDPSDIGIILDNIASNSIKAGATDLKITMSEKANRVEIAFTDNGTGLSKNVNPNNLFEYGMSMNASEKGFGVGLYHIKSLVSEMKGTVNIDLDFTDGFRIIIGLRK